MSAQSRTEGEALRAPRPAAAAPAAHIVPGWLPGLLVGVAALLIGTLYLFLLPPWQHYDEPTHFEYVRLYADLGRRPTETDMALPLRRELAASMVAHDFYGDVPPDLLAPSPRAINIGISEFPHPPLYYFVASLPLRVLGHLDVTSQLYLARGVSLLLFLLLVGAAAGAVGELLPPRHPLRPAVPLALVLFPPFASHMTAVNNDVAAVLFFTLFVWGALRTIARGFSLPRLGWLVATTVLAIVTKSTAAITLPLLPLVLIIALWRRQGWRWQWLALGALLLALLPLLLVLDWQDAAYWYRDERPSVQQSPTRVQHPDAPDGSYVLRLESSPEGWRRLLAPVLPDQVQPLGGKQVTIGGWLWGERAAQGFQPALLESTQGSARLDYVSPPVPVTVARTPTLLAESLTLPDEVAKLYLVVDAPPPGAEDTPTVLYLDNAFLVEGALAPDAIAAVEGGVVRTTDGSTLPNLLRNPSAEQAGPRTSMLVENALRRYGRRSPNYTVMALFDLEQNGSFLGKIVLPWLVQDFWRALAWGHVRLAPLWEAAGTLLGLLALAGAARWLWGSRQRAERPRRYALLFLAATLGLIGLNALLWPLPYSMGGRLILPSARYLYPAILPIWLLLLGGWWALWPRRWRVPALWLLLAGMLLMSGAAVLTIQGYYGRAG